jgi:hypothetical protein
LFNEVHLWRHSRGFLSGYNALERFRFRPDNHVRPPLPAVAATFLGKASGRHRIIAKLSA